MISFQYSECSPDHVGSPGGPRPKNQDGGVRVSIVHRGDTNLSTTYAYPVDVKHNCRDTSCLPYLPSGVDQATS